MTTETITNRPTVLQVVHNDAKRFSAIITDNWGTYALTLNRCKGNAVEMNILATSGIQVLPTTSSTEDLDYFLWANQGLISSVETAGKVRITCLL